MTDAQRDIRRKLIVFDHAKDTKNISPTCRYFGISHDTFYRWKKALAERGEEWAINNKPCPCNIVLRTQPHI